MVLQMKKRHQHITLEAAIPCENQSRGWKQSSKDRYNRLLSLCDTVTVLQDKYTLKCMMERNRYMVDKSDLVIAVWNGESGGTANTIAYAERHRKKLFVIAASEK